MTLRKFSQDGVIWRFTALNEYGLLGSYEAEIDGSCVGAMPSQKRKNTWEMNGGHTVFIYVCGTEVKADFNWCIDEVQFDIFTLTAREKQYALRDLIKSKFPEAKFQKECLPPETPA